MADNPKPFHEAIVDEVWNLSLADPCVEYGLFALESLTIHSVILSNHDAIAAVFNRKFSRLNMSGPHDKLFNHIAAEKARAEEHAQRGAEAIQRLT